MIIVILMMHVHETNLSYITMVLDYCILIEMYITQPKKISSRKANILFISTGIQKIDENNHIKIFDVICV